MKASAAQKKAFDKAFDREWRKLFVHLIERKNVVLTEILPAHDLKSATQTETKFFEDLARDGMIFWLNSFIESEATEQMKESLKADKSITDQINQILKKPKR